MAKLLLSSVANYGFAMKTKSPGMGSRKQLIYMGF
jgi:hypothetical protein